MTRLKHERRQRRLSQRRLAAAAGLNQPYVSMIERGVLVPTPKQLARLAAVFGVPPGELLKEVVIVTIAGAIT